MIQNTFRLDFILKACQGDYYSFDDKKDFQGISTDSRENMPEAIFIALKGDQFDGHDFLEQAVQKGAGLIICHQKPKQNLKTNVLVVKDSLLALQKLANAWRHKKNVEVIGITGTNGKTTTKEFLNTILNQWQPTLASKASLNNHWGVPFSLLSLKEEKIMVSEMGMNHRGEIANLVKIAEPDISVVTNVGRGHLENLKTIENIALEKSDIYRYSPDAKKAFNLDNPHTQKMKKEFAGKQNISFSLKEDCADVYLYFSKPGKVAGKIMGHPSEVDFYVFGEHNLANLAAAVSCAVLAKMPTQFIWQSISKCQTTWGRNQWVDLESKARALFDAYNANPESMRVLLSEISKQQHKAAAYLVLGDMLELGSYNEKEHINLAKEVAKLDFDKVYFVGKNADLFQQAYNKNNLVISKAYEEKLALNLRSMLKPNDTVYLKASRGVKLEKFLLALKPRNFD